MLYNDNGGDGPSNTLSVVGAHVVNPYTPPQTVHDLSPLPAPSQFHTAWWWIAGIASYLCCVLALACVLALFIIPCWQAVIGLIAAVGASAILEWTRVLPS